MCACWWMCACALKKKRVSSCKELFLVSFLFYSFILVCTSNMYIKNTVLDFLRCRHQWPFSYQELSLCISDIKVTNNSFDVPSETHPVIYLRCIEVTFVNDLVSGIIVCDENLCICIWMMQCFFLSFLWIFLCLFVCLRMYIIKMA